MSRTYNMHFSDPSKQPFVIVPLTTDGPAEPLSSFPGQPPIPLHAKAVNANTSLVLLGKGDFEYGEYFQESIVHILENFAGPTEPLYPIEGQLWYDSAIKSLKVNSPFNCISTSFDTVGPNITLRTSNLAAATNFVPGQTVRLTSNVPANAQTIEISAISIVGSEVLIETTTAISGALLSEFPLTIHSTVTNWVPIIIGSGQTFDLDMSGYRIINLGDPIDPEDAVNLQYAVDNFLSTSGGTVDGQVRLVSVTGSVETPRVPVLPEEAVNKLYVDQRISTIQGSFLQTTGGTMTGNLVIDGAKIIINPTSTFEMGAGATFNAGANVLSNLAEPVSPQDAATKLYVDQRIVNSKDGVVYAGNITSDGNLVLNRTEGQSDVIIPGVSPLNHKHLATDIEYDFPYPYANSNFLAKMASADNEYDLQISLQKIVDYIGIALQNLNNPIYRGFFSTAGGDREFELPIILPTYSHRVQIFKNGLKLIEDERSVASVFRLSNTEVIEANTATPLVNGTYDFNIQGTTTGPVNNISITVSQPEYPIVSAVFVDAPVITVTGDVTGNINPGTPIKLIDTGNTETNIFVTKVELINGNTESVLTLNSQTQPPTLISTSKIQQTLSYAEMINAIQAELVNTATLGYQRVQFSTPVVGTASTGLTAGTNYTFDVVVNEQSFATDTVTINGTDAQTFDALVAALNTAGEFSGFTASITANYIQLSSTWPNSLSTVEISNDALFANVTGYQLISPNVNGQAMAAGIELVVGELWFTAGRSGATSRVTLTAGTNDLFSALSPTTDIRQGATITTNRDYFELGETGIGGTTNSILTAAPFAASDVVEYIIQR